VGYLLKESAGKEVVDAIRIVYSGKRYFSKVIMDLLVEDYLQEKDIATAQSPLDSLSTREREILQLVVEGKSSMEIAEKLFLSPKTVDTYRSRLMQKLEIYDLPGLVKFALKQGLIPLD